MNVLLPNKSICLVSSCLFRQIKPYVVVTVVVVTVVVVTVVPVVVVTVVVLTVVLRRTNILMSKELGEIKESIKCFTHTWLLLWWW